MVTHVLTSNRASVPVFADRVFEGLPRTDQRRWAQAYVEGLLTTPGKKTVRRLAAQISDSPTASQSLHQFVNASPWDWNPVRAELSRWAEQEMTPQAWVVGQAVLRKRGEHSCGVHRRYVPATGRSVTCQLGVGAFLASADKAVPVDWRLMLPGSWSKDPERRQRTRIPDEAVSRTVEQHALDLVDSLVAASGTAPLPVVCDLESATGTAALVRGLALRGRDFVVAVPSGMQVMVGRHLRVQRPQAGGPEGPAMAVSAGSLFEFDAGMLTRMETVASLDGRGRHTTVMTSYVRLPEPGTAGAQTYRTYRLFAVRPEDGRRPVQLWLTSLMHARMESVLALTRLLPRATEAVREMAEDFGLVDFEGRSYPGWHHHMTLVSAAYAYSRLDRRPVRTPEPMLAAA